MGNDGLDKDPPADPVINISVDDEGRAKVDTEGMSEKPFHQPCDTTFCSADAVDLNTKGVEMINPNTAFTPLSVAMEMATKAGKYLCATVPSVINTNEGFKCGLILILFGEKNGAREFDQAYRTRFVRFYLVDPSVFDKRGGGDNKSLGLDGHGGERAPQDVGKNNDVNLLIF